MRLEQFKDYVLRMAFLYVERCLNRGEAGVDTNHVGWQVNAVHVAVKYENGSKKNYCL